MKQQVWVKARSQWPHMLSDLQHALSTREKQLEPKPDHPKEQGKSEAAAVLFTRNTASRARPLLEWGCTCRASVSMTLHGCEHPVAQGPLFFSQSGLMSSCWLRSQVFWLPGQGWLLGRNACWNAMWLGYALLEAVPGAARHDSRHQFALMHPMQPEPGYCLQWVFWLWMAPVCGRVHSCSVAGGSLQGVNVMVAISERNGSACRKKPVLLPPRPTWASCKAREGGYSAVRVLRYTPCSFTPAML